MNAFFINIKIFSFKVNGLLKRWEIETSNWKGDRQYNVQEKNLNDKRLATKQYDMCWTPLCKQTQIM
jgi:hypothetical protein